MSIISKPISRIQFASNLINFLKGEIVCDLGCRDQILKKYLKGDFNYIGVDYVNVNQNNFINIRIEKNLENVTITVEDNGPGFSKGSLKKVFDRFYTDRPKNEKFGNHSGLGLSISKQIVEAHDGSIEALNRLNQKNECLGGNVKVTFPEVKN